MLIDISRLLGRAGQGRLPTGVDRVGLAYLARWGAGAQAVLQKGTWRRLVPVAESQAMFALVQRPPADFAWRLKLLIARACVPPWPAQDAQGRVAFYLGHSELDRPGFGAWLRRTRQRPVFFVHDLIPITHPEYCRPGETAAHMQRMRLALELGAGVVANSAATLASLAAFAKTQGVTLPPSAVALLAPAALPVPDNLNTRPLTQPYFVVLGTIEPRKNHVLLLTLWRVLAEQLGAAAPHLVVIGQRGWECENAADLLERCEAMRGLVHEVPHCPDAELARYLHHAQALLFPSFAEGYGMPLAEALHAGTPVLASDLPVFKEVAGDVPEYLSPLDGLGWLETITAYAAPDSQRRQAQLQRMQGLTLPTWDGHFAQVQDLLDRIEPAGVFEEMKSLSAVALAEQSVSGLPAVANSVVVAYGFSWRKRAFVRSFTQRADIAFVRRGAQVPGGATLLLWGATALPMGLPSGVKVVRLEDGFLRSVGLGADLTRPLSWVVDDRGIYFDARTPSALELMLQNGLFSQRLLARAEQFRQQVVAAGLSKYNLAAAPWRRPEAHKQVVLVPGQVETDASIATGAVDIKTNMALLQAVRLARPDAWVVYKPHPDVVAGLRQPGAQEAQALKWCNEVVLQASMSQLLDELDLVDEVHVMTSLTGFEALLRGKTVVCYGQPFYAGWGLTLDRHPHPRRSRQLALDELVAAALLLYPVYVSRATGLVCVPEQALQELLAWRQQCPGGLVWWRRWLRPLLARA